MSAFKIALNILKEMVILCTKECIFTSLNDELYQQVNGTAMGSPLGPTFANFYFRDIKDKIFKKFFDNLHKANKEIGLLHIFI